MTSKDRVPYPSPEGLQFDQFLRAKQYIADVGAYQRQCARDRKDNYVASSTSGSGSDVELQASPSPENYAFKRQSLISAADKSLKSLTVRDVAKPLFSLADNEVRLDTVGDVTSASTMVRGVSEGERAVVHLDAAKQSNSLSDLLDDFLVEHAKELDTEVGVLDYIGMSVENDGLNIVEPSWTSDEDLGTTGGLPPSMVVIASDNPSRGRSEETLPAAPPAAATPDVDVAAAHAEDAAAVVALLAATTPIVDTAVSPIFDLPFGVLPVDIVDVVELHSGLSRSRLLELVEERSVVSVSDRQKQTIEQLLDLVVSSCQSAATSLEQHVEALNMAWDPGEDPAGVLAVQKYQKALQVPFQLYRCLLEESFDPGDVEELFQSQ